MLEYLFWLSTSPSWNRRYQEIDHKVTKRHGNGEWFIFITYRSIDDLAFLSLLLGIAFSIPLFSI